MNMPDGNTAALRVYEAEQARGQKFQDAAERDRERLVFEKLADMKADELAELMSGINDPEMNTCLQRIVVAQRGQLDERDRETIVSAACRISKLLLDNVDFVYGDELVEKQANAIEEHVPCQCRGDCTC